MYGGVVMTITTFSSRPFNQDASKAKKAAQAGPVFITDRGRPAHVWLTFCEYVKITGSHTKITDLLAMLGIEHIELECPRSLAVSWLLMLPLLKAVHTFMFPILVLFVMG